MLVLAGLAAAGLAAGDAKSDASSAALRFFSSFFVFS
jgi:hypothetical protein